MGVPKLSSVVAVCASLGILMCSAPPLPGLVWAQLDSCVPSDLQLCQQRMTEVAPGFFVIAVPPPGTLLRPVQRVPREEFGVVGPFPLTLNDLNALIYPDASPDERQAVLEGMTFFTTPHTAAEGAGPMANQPFCLGCHRSSAEAIPSAGLVNPDSCIPGSTCVSLVSRAGRSTPTNFKFTAGDPTTGGRAADHLDAVNDTGQTAAFTIFGDFSPRDNFFDRLDGSPNPVTGFRQPFGGFVQHTRPSIPACLPDRIPTIGGDQNLRVTDPMTGLSPLGFRRSVGERAGPPYIGRGLMEAVPNTDILANEDPNDTQGHKSSLGNFALSLGCTRDCISGRHNQIMATGTFPQLFASGLGRFGLRANGAEIMQFSIGGLQGELGFTSALNQGEINLPDIEGMDCRTAFITQQANAPEVHLSTAFSERNHIRLTAPPEFGRTLLNVLRSPDPGEPQHGESTERKVRRGAELFGIDLMAFANRMIPGRMPSTGDGLDPHAINQADRKLNCVGCHTPIHRTGQSPADLGAQHLSFVWAPIFSDLLLHKGPVIDAERFAPTPRDPLLIRRVHLEEEEVDEDENRDDHDKKGDHDKKDHDKKADHDDDHKKADRDDDDVDRDDDEQIRLFDSFDVARSLADDVFSAFQAVADGREFRTAPLMGVGRMGPPFLHDARVYLSRLTVNSPPAGTVMTSSEFTNAPLVVRTLDDALRAAIELHDLPPPDDAKTPNLPGAGCPVPPAGVSTNVAYGSSPQDVICPPFDSATSQSHRGEAREVIGRFRELSPEDQQALIEFLKQL